MNLPFDIHQLIIQFWLPFIRVAALLMSMPLLGTALVPKRVKIFLSVGISIILFPLLANSEIALPDSISMFQLVLLTVQQMLIGLVIGLSVHVIFQAFIVAGEVSAMQMGLGFASMNDPQSGVAVPTLSQFYLTIVTLLFLALNGHLYLIQMIVESFDTIPVNLMDLSFVDTRDLMRIVGWIFISGLKIALPAIGALLIVNMAVGVMTKATPQINIFALGFPITMILGFIILWFVASIILPQFIYLFEQLMTELSGWVH